MVTLFLYKRICICWDMLEFFWGGVALIFYCFVVIPDELCYLHVTSICSIRTVHKSTSLVWFDMCYCILQAQFVLHAYIMVDGTITNAYHADTSLFLCYIVPKYQCWYISTGISTLPHMIAHAVGNWIQRKYCIDTTAVRKFRHCAKVLFLCCCCTGRTRHNATSLATVIKICQSHGLISLARYALHLFLLEASGLSVFQWLLICDGSPCCN